MSFARAGLVAMVMLVLWAGQATANPASRVTTENVTASLVAEGSSVQPGERIWLGLHMDIRPGWHVYWRNPGDSGLPPVVDWTVPAGAVLGELLFPLPERIPFGPLVNYGYGNTVLFPVALDVPADAHGTVTVDAAADWLVCQEICIPESGSFKLSLPVSDEPPQAVPGWSPAITVARADIPAVAPWSSQFAVTEAGIRLDVTLGAEAANSLQPTNYFPFYEGAIEHAAPQVFEATTSGLSVLLAPGYGVQRQNGLQTLDGVLAFEEPDGTVRGVELRPERVDASALPAIAAGGATGGASTETGSPGDTRADWSSRPDGGTARVGIGTALLFALLGGLILNLMPCVFPILFLKALTFVEESRSAPGRVRAQGIAFTAGVLVSFAIIAGVLYAFLSAGAQVGWGFQLQSPQVVGALALLFLVVGLNFSGVFSVGHGLANLGGGLASQSGSAGSFFTGVLATIVATPCTAPFMGAAIGFALSQPAHIGMSVFLALGLGMALPWLVLSFSPPLLRLLPKPGAWMERLKQALAFPMYATAGWLVWVLAQQAGPVGLAGVLASAVALAFAFWLVEATRGAGPVWKATGVAGLVGALTLSVYALSDPGRGASALGGAVASPVSAIGDQLYEPWSADRLQDARAGGQPVFLNFTAAWCITCLVNERVALSSDRVRARLAEAGVVSLKADWTNHDTEITAALASYGRSGVPLYVLYRPGATEPELLPQLLTEETVMAALEGL